MPAESIPVADAAAAHSTPASGEAGTATPAYSWYVVFLLFVVFIVSYVDRMALAILAPQIKADLGLSDSQVGLLTGIAFSLFYAICTVPLARWADRGVRRDIIALSIVGWSVMTALCGAAQNFVQLFLARVGVGVGEAGANPAAQSLTCDYIPPVRRPAAFAAQTFGNNVGLVLGMTLAGVLAETIGWRWTFFALGVPGILVAILVRVTLREPVRGRLDVAGARAAPKAGFLAALRILMRNRTYLAVVAIYALNGFVQTGLNQWWPSLYTRSFGLSLSTTGAWLGIAMAVGSGSGLLLGGFIATRAAARDVRYPLVIGALAILVGLPLIAVSLFIASAGLSIVLVGIVNVLWALPIGAIITAGNGVVPAPIRATAASICVLSAAFLGFGLGPLAVGLASDLLTPSLGGEALRYAMLVPVAIMPIWAWAYYRASVTLIGDLSAIR